MLADNRRTFSEAEPASLLHQNTPPYWVTAGSYTACEANLGTEISMNLISFSANVWSQELVQEDYLTLLPDGRKLQVPILPAAPFGAIDWVPGGEIVGVTPTSLVKSLFGDDATAAVRKTDLGNLSRLEGAAAHIASPCGIVAAPFRKAGQMQALVDSSEDADTLEADKKNKVHIVRCEQVSLVGADRLCRL